MVTVQIRSEKICPYRQKRQDAGQGSDHPQTVRRGHVHVFLRRAARLHDAAVNMPMNTAAAEEL